MYLSGGKKKDRCALYRMNLLSYKHSRCIEEGTESFEGEVPVVSLLYTPKKFRFLNV